VVASTLTGIYVAFGNGDGTFQPGTVYAGLRVDQNVQLAVADLNHDGSLDIWWLPQAALRDPELRSPPFIAIYVAFSPPVKQNASPSIVFKAKPTART
jgi:hypothetical protein